MSGPFDWSNKTDGAGSKQQLPIHIEKMNAGLRPPKMKKSGDGNNLPWGGEPKEQAKAYASGLPKNKGSMVSKTGERGAKGVSSLPSGGKSSQGFKPTIKAKHQAAGKKK